MMVVCFMQENKFAKAYWWRGEPRYDDLFFIFDPEYRAIATGYDAVEIPLALTDGKGGDIDDDDDVVFLGEFTKDEISNSSKKGICGRGRRSDIEGDDSFVFLGKKRAGESSGTVKNKFCGC
ncbi:hypothetical protein Salat_2880100 [Sesamum alatum]|uniref:Uncharacterized protein n=1 Tax=Sesamum alatum TaxID=300844 RepID=A0AAE1XMN3_9LAMI|nr:hypothetical protein Salat_2880100 [Sesamum alatum]